MKKKKGKKKSFFKDKVISKRILKKPKQATLVLDLG